MIMHCNIVPTYSQKYSDITQLWSPYCISFLTSWPWVTGEQPGIIPYQAKYGMALAQTDFGTDSSDASSQWETSLQSNDVSHWLGANLESAVRLVSWIDLSIEWYLEHSWHFYHVYFLIRITGFECNLCTITSGYEAVVWYMKQMGVASEMKDKMP